MTERIDEISYKKAELDSTVEGTETTLWATGPAEFICKEIAASLLKDDVWKALFGEYVDGYKRMDYPIRGLPALRIYNNDYVKSFDSWFIEGDIVCDLIFPASIRRAETEQLPDSITAALLQQFRRPSFFEDLCSRIPGLNELGKRFNVDKSLAFEWEEQEVPLTQINVNFRLDLRAWDLYLESDNRTKDDPFVRTLGDLKKIVSTIQALRDDNTTVELTLGIDQKV